MSSQRIKFLASIWVVAFPIMIASGGEFVPSEKAAQAGSQGSEYFMEWHRFTTVHAYESVGSTNAIWDGEVKAAFETLGMFLSRPPGSDGARLRSILGRHVDKAIELGCDDPLLGYLHFRYFVLGRPGSSQANVSEAFIDIALAMEKSGYSPFRKFFANVRAAGTTQVLNQGTTNTLKSTSKFESAAVQELNEFLKDRTIPPKSVAGAMDEIILMTRQSKEMQAQLETLIFPTLVKNWASNTFAHAVTGKYYIDKAWRERGYGTSSTVTESQAKEFFSNLEIAEQRLTHGWEVSTNDEVIPIQMITVCMGLGHPRSRMETWFSRAMAANPDSYAAVNAKAYYLEPKWMGSEEELLAFGRECVASKQWGGRVPLALRNAHETLQKWKADDEANYYSRPEVWRDVKAGYDKYFDLSPRDFSMRQNYARDAYRSGQYKEFLEQIQRFGGGVNYELFGGKDKFDAMRTKAMGAVSRGD